MRTRSTWLARYGAGLMLAAGLLGGSVSAMAQASAGGVRTRNVVLIMADGMRWQEVFGGAEAALMTRKAGHVQDTAALRRQFGGATRAARRHALMPFLWDTIARRGQLFCDRTNGGDAHVTNSFRFSYPGYNETLTGRADPRIDSNSYGPNPNRTVFEWLNGQPGFEGRVAAFGTWDAFDDIFNRARSGLYVRAGWDVPLAQPRTGRDSLTNELYGDVTRLWGDLAYDGLMQAAVMQYVRERKPRVLFVGYGETDEWAHMGRYDQYLHSAHRVDRFIEQLWAEYQSMPEYRGRTTFIITTDHGRGTGPSGWRTHGQGVDGAENIWVAVIGPDTPALGERTTAVMQSQIAATIAALLGEDYRAAAPQAAPPIPGVMGAGLARR